MSTTSSVSSIAGSFSTTYMTNGQPGVSFTISKSCNNNSGCNSGETSAGIWKNDCYDHDGRHLRGTICISPSPTSACPAIGTVSSAQYYGPNNQVASSGASNPSGIATLKCVYSSITNPFDTTTVSAFTGTGASDLSGTNGMQKKYCDGQNYNDMTLGPCANFYTRVTGDFDYQQVFRINQEYSNGAWAATVAFINVVRRVATGNGYVSSTLGKNLAQTIITNYCIVNNPNGWPDNKVIRTMINQWALNGAGSLQTQAIDIINHFCQANPTSIHCNCWQAYQYGNNFISSCTGKTTGACTDLNNILASFTRAPAVFAPQIATIRQNLIPKCTCGACADITSNESSIYLTPDTFQNLSCDVNIQMCLQSVSVQGSLDPGAYINQKCQSSGLPASVPNC